MRRDALPLFQQWEARYRTATDQRGRLVNKQHGKVETFWSHAVSRQMDQIRSTVAHMGKQHVGTSVGGTTYQRAASQTKEQKAARTTSHKTKRAA